MATEQKVDWKKFAEMENTHREGTRSQTLYEKEVNRLMRLGILSFSPENGFSLHAEGILLSPRSYNLVEIYFTDKKHATEYAKAQYGNSVYKDSISIAKYDDSGKVCSLRSLEL